MMKLRSMRALILCLAGMLFCLPLFAQGEEGETDPSTLRLRELHANQDEAVTWSALSNVPCLAEYLARHEGAASYAGDAIPCQIESSGTQQVTLTAQVPEDGFYTIWWTYLCEETDSDLYASFTLDGGVPYQEAASACFTWQWNEQSAPIRNAIGDDVRPQQCRLSPRSSGAFTNPEGFVPGPLRFFLTAGTHEMTLTFTTRAATLERCTLMAPEQPAPYETLLTAALEAGWQQAQNTLTLEAEEAVLYKSSASIQRAASDDPLSTPYEMGYKRFNTLGGDSFSQGGQQVVWRFTVPETALYAIAFRYSVPTEQLPVYRSLRIDGMLPFAEAASCLFAYQEDLELTLLPYLLPLTAGEHTLSLTVDASPYYPTVQAIRQVNDELSQIMLDITMLVGTKPDPNYDYEINKAMPSLSDDLKRLSGVLSTQCDGLRSLCGSASLAENSLRQNAELLLVVERNMARIQNSITDITSIQTNLSLWEEELSSAPLLLDKILLGPVEMAADGQVSTTGQRAQAMLHNFLLSFSKDYDQVGGRAQGEELVVLDVWASMSIEAADVLKELCDATFTNETGIAINLNVMPAGQLNAGAVNALLLSIVSGTQPDVALGVSAGTPVELAIRDAVVDLSTLPGYEELVCQYPQNSLVANSFMGGVYGIPERMDFTVLFYRKDILSALNLALPQTWEDVYNKLLPILYQNSLEMFVPHDFATFLYQYGGSYYSADGLRTTLDTPQGYQAFKNMTDLYTKYAIPYSTNFYNRFRTGEVPVGVAKFGDYMSLTVGASNLSGKWGITQIPGVRQADGTVNHATANMVTASSVLMSSSEEQEAAWAFLKWWLSAQTQSDYCRQVELRIGTGARVNTANTEAFASLNWPVEDLEILLAAREANVETPGVLGGYYTTRHMTNAWNAVINNSDQGNVRDEYEHAIEMIQTELDNKQVEYRHLLPQ